MKALRSKIWVAMLAALVLAGCGSNVVLDNPSTEQAVFTIDGADAYTVAAGARQEISLGSGSHKVQVQLDKTGVTADSTINVKEGGVIHTGTSDYILWRQLYGLQNDRASLLNEDWVMVDSTKFFGDIKIHPAGGLYIEQNWTLGLADEMPDAQALYITKDFQVESKIFRASEFVATYRAMAEKNKKAGGE